MMSTPFPATKQPVAFGTSGITSYLKFTIIGHCSLTGLTSMRRKEIPVTGRLRKTFLDRIRKGTWPVGSELPSERELMSEFGVSRIPLREAIAGLRALGVL